MSIPELTSWKLELIRLTIFLAEPCSTEQNWWQYVTGNEPETSVSKRQTGDYIDEGNFSDWKLSLTINVHNQNRIDWLAYSQSPSPDGFSSIGQYMEQSQIFFEALNGWLLKECPSVSRIAYGVILINEAPNRTAAYQMLESCLPFIKFDIDNWSDFFFQTNKKGKSTVVEGLALNQLSKWNALKLMRIHVENMSFSQVESHACRLELDINTASENITPIPPEKLSLIVAELKQIADHFASEGYPA